MTFSTILTSLTAFFTSISPWSAAFGTGLGALFTWVVNSYIQRKQQRAAAVTAMQQDEDAHAGDGALSVGDATSAQSQIQDLNGQLAQIDAQAKVNQSKGK